MILVKPIAESQSDLPCFKNGVNSAINGLNKRLMPKGANVKLNKKQCEDEIDAIINQSINAFSTRLYDQYQYCC